MFDWPASRAAMLEVANSKTSRARTRVLTTSHATNALRRAPQNFVVERDGVIWVTPLSRPEYRLIWCSPNHSACAAVPASRCGQTTAKPCLHRLIGQRIMNLSQHSVQRQPASTTLLVPGSFWTHRSSRRTGQLPDLYFVLASHGTGALEANIRYLDPCGRSGLSSSTRSGALHGCHASDPVVPRRGLSAMPPQPWRICGGSTLVRRS